MTIFLQNFKEKLFSEFEKRRAQRKLNRGRFPSTSVRCVFLSITRIKQKFDRCQVNQIYIYIDLVLFIKDSYKI
jgi:hypothetical protein